MDGAATRSTRLHAAAVGAAAVLCLVAVTGSGAPWPWIGFWAAGLLLTAGASYRPEWGLAGYAATLYGTPRYYEFFEVLVRSPILHVQVLATLSGYLIWRRQGGVAFRRTALLTVALALFGWGALSFAAALSGDAVTYPIRHAPAFYLHAVILLVVASQVMGHEGAARRFLLPMAAAISARMAWQGPSGLWLEGDFGPLTLMVLPLLVLAARTDPVRPLRVVLAVVSGAALSAVALTYNRASAVAFGAVAALTCWRLRRNRGLLIAAAVVVIGVVGWLPSSAFAPRFAQAWAELSRGGWGSVTERFALWRAGGAIAADHPVLGVGPGRYPDTLAAYAPNLRGMVAHNSYVNVAAETGVPGLVLYLTLLALALHRSQRTISTTGSGWPAGEAAALQTSLVAYLVASLFISRHDMVLAYLLIGWIASLPARASNRMAVELA